MIGFLLRVLRSFRAEIVLGFLIATIFWTGVLGWQAAYAPTDAQKQECYEAAKKEGHKSEECKAFWERATSDPVAFFTLWLVIFTGGLTVSTIMLWLAGERQIDFLERNSEAQARDMQASLAAAKMSAEASASTAEAARRTLESDRAWLTWKSINTINLTNTSLNGRFYNKAFAFSPVWINTGRSPAQRVRTVNMVKVVERHRIGIDGPFPVFHPGAGDRLSTDTGRGVGEHVSGYAVPISDIKSADVEAGKADVFFYSRVTYVDVFNPEIERTSEVCLQLGHAGPTAVMEQADGSKSQWGIRVVGEQNRVT